MVEPKLKLNVASEGVPITSGALSFRSAYNFGSTKKFGQDLSRKVEDVYELDDDGNPVKVGESNIYEQIQACKDECEIYNILKRYDSGDLLAIPSPDDGTIHGVDFTKVDTNVLSSMQNMDVALANWQKLPKGLRALYHDNITEFMSATPEDINKNVNAYIESLTPKPKEGDGE